MKGLVIKQPWIRYILEGKKTWEIRGRQVILRERIALIEGGSGLIKGACDIVGCVGPLSAQEIRKNEDKHRVPAERMREVTYEKTFAWVLANVTRFETPVPYKHPSGAVIWVSLDATNVPEFNRLTSQMKSSGRAPSASNGAKQEDKPSWAPAAAATLPAMQSSTASPPTNLPFGPEVVASQLSMAFGAPTDSTQYAHRWRLTPSIGIGLDRRSRGSGTVFISEMVSLDGSGLSAKSIQTGIKSYGLNSNMKSVPGCEPGKLVQRVALARPHDVDRLVECLRKAMSSCLR
jgi:hypothetical protein